MTTFIFCNEKAGTFEAYSQQMGSIVDVLQEITGKQSEVLNVQDVNEEHLAQADQVIVMGGDGTVGRILGLVAKHKPRIPVGIIPAGTGNLLAHCLGLVPDKTEDKIAFALEVIRHGRTVSMDLGVANGTPFALDLGVGPIAMAVTEPGKQEKNTHGLLSYVRPLLKSMFQNPYRFHVVADGVSIECEASAIFVTNPQELGIGQKADASKLRDGKLNLFILNPKNLDDYVGIAMRFGSWFLGNAETDNMPYSIFEVTDVTIEAVEEIVKPPILSVIPGTSAAPESTEGTKLGADEQPMTMLDGDVFGHTPVVVSILPHAVDIYVPLKTVA